MVLLRLSSPTLLLALCIIYSAGFVRNIYDFLLKFFTRGQLAGYIYILSISFFCGFAYYFRGSKNAFRRIFLVGIVFLAAIFAASRMPLLEERVHLIEYGFLGFFARRDYSLVKFGLLWSLIFVFLIGTADEMYQRFLPQRVFDLRDIFFNLAGGVLGIVLYIVSAKPVTDKCKCAKIL